MRFGAQMMNTSWKITTMRDGNAVGSVEGVSSKNAARAIRNAMYGREVYGPEVLKEIEAAQREQVGSEAIAA
jgi:hypothetical protein